MSVWNLFPYPTALIISEEGGGLIFEDGSLIAAPEVCTKCPTFECQYDVGAPKTEVHECRFGINYVRLDENRLVVGVVTTGLPSASRRSRSKGRKHPALRVPAGDVLAAVERAASLGPAVSKDFEQSKQEVLRGLRDSPEMFAGVAKQLKEEFQENLSQSHDFLQLAKLVKGYAETLLQQKYPNLSNEDAAEKLPVEGAIYFSTELMLLKLDALVFLHEINLVYGDEKRFKAHPFILKYCRIYRWQAEQKDLDLQLSGASYGSCRYNSQAIGAVVQGLLDNLVKYAPAGSKATIVFHESPEDIRIDFTSLGPRIEDMELQQIFLPGFRAVAARGAASSGLGLGLATAKQVSDALDLNLHVHQEPTEDLKYRGRYPTTFSIRLRRVE
jgi:signal transduction histidine kinase